MSTHRVWRWITPPSIRCSLGSCLASGRYGHTCAVESRSHMASISPVMTNVSGLPSSSPARTVVSSVFGKQFSNIHPNCGSAMVFLISSMRLSTAGLVKWRWASGGRWLVKVASANKRAVWKPRAGEEARNARRVVIGLLPWKHTVAWGRRAAWRGCRRQLKQRPSFESAEIAGSYPGSPVALDGNHTVIHQHAIARIQAAIALAVHGEFLSADPYVRVAAGHVMVSRGVDLLRTGSAGAVAIRDDNGVGSEGRFDTAEEEVVTAAARGEKERGGEKQDGPGSHGCEHKLIFSEKSRRWK